MQKRRAGPLMPEEVDALDEHDWTEIDSGRAFTIQVVGECLRIPLDAEFNIEHEPQRAAPRTPETAHPSA
ncbi:MAG TPA: hypothetical protein PKJ45_13955 [Rubrivivax sp.]|nr:hypothetical protein [Rubrivivax sp.]